MIRRLILTLAALLPAVPALAEDGAPPLPDVGIEQRLGESVPLDLHFRNEKGQPIRLGDCMAGKPAVLILAYYRCPMLCTQVLNGLVRALGRIPYDVGDRFSVIVVSIDPHERSVLAAAKKASYVSQYGRPGTADGWHFLTGDEPAITELARAVGFRYKYDPKLDQFAHGSGLMVVTPDGKLSHYFYGIAYAPVDLRLALVESSEGKIGSPADQVLLLCYHYDAATGRYTPTVRNLLRLGGGLTLVVLGLFLARAWRAELRKKPQAEPNDVR